MKLKYIGFTALMVAPVAVMIGGLFFGRYAEVPVMPQAASSVVTVGPITVEGAWVAEPLGGQSRTAVYLVIRNGSDVDERLLAISSPAATATTLHRTTTEDNISRMESVDALILPAQGEVSLAPGGLHIMMTGLNAPLQTGEMVPLTLLFLEVGEVSFEAPVRTRAEMMNADQ